MIALGEIHTLGVLIFMGINFRNSLFLAYYVFQKSRNSQNSRKLIPLR